MLDVLESEEDKPFAGKVLKRCVSVGTFEKISKEELYLIMGEGKMVSSSFVARKGEGTERKVRIVINFSRQSKYLLRKTVNMKTVQCFAI